MLTEKIAEHLLFYWRNKICLIALSIPLSVHFENVYCSVIPKLLLDPFFENLKQQTSNAMKSNVSKESHKHDRTALY